MSETLLHGPVKFKKAVTPDESRHANYELKGAKGGQRAEKNSDATGCCVHYIIFWAYECIARRINGID